MARFRRYPQYKESGVEWLGEVPRHWAVTQVRRAATRIQTGTTPPTVREDYYTDGGVPWYGPSSFGSELTLTHPVKMVSESAIYDGAARLFAEGSTLIVTIGATIGKVGYLEAPGSSNQQITAVTPRADLVEARFLALQLKRLEPVLRGIAPNTTIPIIDQQEVACMPVAVPPLFEQRAIATFLDRETAKIDALISKKERLIELLQEKRTAIITRAVTKGLDPNVPVKDSGVEWLPRIPKHWDVKPNGLFFRERDERGHPELQILNVSIHTRVTIREFCDDKIEQKAEDHSIYKCARKGDIAFNKMRMWQGAVGVAPCDGLVSPDYTVARPIADLEPEYFGLLFRTSLYKTEINRYSHGIVMDRNRLYWENFKAIKSPCPPLEEQQRILQWIANRTGPLDELLEKVRDGIKRLHEFRSALISAAVTGKIDVRDQVPTTALGDTHGPT